MIVYTPLSPHRTILPMGLRRFMYLTAASLMINEPAKFTREAERGEAAPSDALEPVSVSSSAEKSLPCTICQPTDLPKSGVTVLVKKLSCKLGSFPSHLYPILLLQLLVRSC